MIKISVIVPFYNSEPYIAECIEGLLSQKYPIEHHEIVMVDNNSTDASAEIVKRHSCIKLVSEEKQGAYAARNRGLREAKGEIIAFTDPDCIPSSDWLERIATAMNHPDVGIVIGSHQLARNSFFLSLLADYENEKNRYVFSSKIKEIYYGHTNNMAVRKKLFDEIGPFIERSRGADTIFVSQCVDRSSCEVVRYFPEIRVQHKEIDNLGKLYRKFFIYGRSRENYRHIAYVRPLTTRERFLVFRRTVRNGRYSLIKSVFLLGLLVVGLVYWISGSISASANREQ
jgi:glycosyltransferase involved in cell wall biosynthesis